MKSINIDIPNGYEIDLEDSDLLNGKISFKKKHTEIKVYQDLIDNQIPIVGYNIGETTDRLQYFDQYSSNRNTYLTVKQAGMAHSIAEISQLMPFYGGAITDEEWEDNNFYKYTIQKNGNHAYYGLRTDMFYCFLAFHTREQRDSFLENNKQLVKDYLMIDSYDEME
jgi:hypothetical protein